MAIAEDIRNLFKEFGGRVESYVEFDHYVGRQRGAAAAEPQQVRVAGGDVTPATGAADGAAREPKVDQPLGAVFARLAGRAPDK